MRCRVPIWALIAVLAPAAAVADVAPADTLLTTYFTASYSDSSGGSYTACSAQAGCKVKQTYGVSVSVLGGNWQTIPEGGSTPVLCSITNNGNGFDTFNITSQKPPAGWDMTVLDDTNQDGVWQSNEWASYSVTGQLKRGETHKFFVRTAAGSSSILNDGLKSLVSATSVGSPSVRSDNVVVEGRKALFWRQGCYQLGHPVTSADTGGDSTRVFYGDGSGYVYSAATNPFNGFSTVKTIRLVTGTPAITTDRVMWATTDGSLVTIDKNANTVIRTISTPDGSQFRDSPAVYGTYAIAAGTSGRVFAISRDGVATLTSDRVTNAFGTTPLVVGSNVFVGTNRGEIAVFDANTLKLKYVDTLDSNASFTGRLVADPTGTFLAVSSSASKAYSYNIAARSLMWAKVLPTTAVGIAATDNRGVYLLLSNRELHGYDLYNGATEPAFPFKVPGTVTLSSGLTVAKRSSDASSYLWLGTPEGMVYAVCATLGLQYYYCDLSVDSAQFLSDPSTAGGKAALGSSIGWSYLFDPK